MKFNIFNTSGFARRAELDLPRGKIQTPAFMPVGTNGTVKGLEVESLLETNSEIILAKSRSRNNEQNVILTCSDRFRKIFLWDKMIGI